MVTYVFLEYVLFGGNKRSDTLIEINQRLFTLNIINTYYTKIVPVYSTIVIQTQSLDIYIYNILQILVL